MLKLCILPLLLYSPSYAASTRSNAVTVHLPCKSTKSIHICNLHIFACSPGLNLQYDPCYCESSSQMILYGKTCQSDQGKEPEYEICEFGKKSATKCFCREQKGVSSVGQKCDFPANCPIDFPKHTAQQSNNITDGLGNSGTPDDRGKGPTGGPGNSGTPDDRGKGPTGGPGNSGTPDDRGKGPTGGLGNRPGNSGTPDDRGKGPTGGPGNSGTPDDRGKGPTGGPGNSGTPDDRGKGPTGGPGNSGTPDDRGKGPTGGPGNSGTPDDRGKGPTGGPGNNKITASDGFKWPKKDCSNNSKEQARDKFANDQVPHNSPSTKCKESQSRMNELFVDSNKFQWPKKIGASAQKSHRKSLPQCSSGTVAESTCRCARTDRELSRGNYCPSNNDVYCLPNRSPMDTNESRCYCPSTRSILYYSQKCA
ncbi:hypothetical protein PRIPAC_96561 [Pristionchus pacificus]|uniref:Uncharacterized protein n=1 Tax=Pristionchus pacificus TaxID=54126 RepID=A0A2A6BKB8_PRIPA|nr:hypothetical protein PRIPAC_96561 [Pristionchus pacificus]|eukprot:PDM66231.1 hypothetical protein PRIPAC_45456 [Pristionchus pacificus]